MGTRYLHIQETSGITSAILYDMDNFIAIGGGG